MGCLEQILVFTHFFCMPQIKIMLYVLVFFSHELCNRWMPVCYQLRYIQSFCKKKIQCLFKSKKFHSTAAASVVFLKLRLRKMVIDFGNCNCNGNLCFLFLFCFSLFVLTVGLPELKKSKNWPFHPENVFHDLKNVSDFECSKSQSQPVFFILGAGFWILHYSN